MRYLSILLLVASGFAFATQAEAHYRHHHWWHHGHYVHSGTSGRLGLGASPHHPEGPGNPASGK